MNKLALYCRSGFEKEVAAEITEKATALGVFGFARVIDNSGYVIFECYQTGEADRLAREIPFDSLIFARQMIVVSDLLEDLPPVDRITPIIQQYQFVSTQIKFNRNNDIWVETADTNEAKELLGFCRKFTVPLRSALKKQGWLTGASHQKSGLNLHCFFIKSSACYVGYSYSDNHSPHFMGIPRLKFPIDAPSGWTYQLVKRGLFVYAVDHGKMAASLHDTGRIEHCPEDGFKFQPPKRKQIHWLVCDMVEKPSRITALIGKWLLNGWCRETIFNLKLPMKKRYVEVQLCLQKLADELHSHGLKFHLQAKHLYHDREEITVYIQIK